MPGECLTSREVPFCAIGGLLGYPVKLIQGLWVQLDMPWHVGMAVLGGNSGRLSKGSFYCFYII